MPGTGRSAHPGWATALIDDRRGNVNGMPSRSHKIAKPAAALGVLATMASIWWFALRPRRKNKLDS
jgi:hypothetical protein